MLWVSSMPCRLSEDDAIPLGQFWHVQRLTKTVYCMTRLPLRRRMQTHFGHSLQLVFARCVQRAILWPDLQFRRHAFLLLFTSLASPAVCSTFVAGRQHQLQSLNAHTMYFLALCRASPRRSAIPERCTVLVGGELQQPRATVVLFAHSADPLPPAYEAIGVRGPDGAYRQLATSLLQIENWSSHGTICPKRVIFPGERPPHALRERVWNT